MAFQYIKIYNFRNLENNTIYIEKPVVFLIGQNGQGKTNFLESIYYSCYGSSFRASRDKHVIMKNENNCHIQGKYISDDLISKNVDIHINHSGKDIHVDGKKIADRKTLLENIPCIVFSHDDMIFIKGTPETKRKFFNQTICLFDILFIDLLRNYQKILKNRNVLLKKSDNHLIEVYDQHLAEFGIELCNKREQMVYEFNQILTPLFSEITNTNDCLEIKYMSSWKHLNDIDRIRKNLKKTIIRDRNFKTTTSGPHRDNFQYMFNGSDFSQCGSTGQIRLAALIIKMAQAVFFIRKTGKKPVLLLDDVLLEIDHPKRRRVLEKLPAFEQAFFTFLPNEKFYDYPFEDPLKLIIENGMVKKWKKPETY